MPESGDVGVEQYIRGCKHSFVGSQAVDRLRRGRSWRRSGGGLQPCDTERPCQAQDAEAGSEALLGVRPSLLAIAARSHVHGDALALDEDLYGPAHLWRWCLLPASASMRRNTLAHLCTLWFGHAPPIYRRSTTAVR